LGIFQNITKHIAIAQDMFLNEKHFMWMVQCVTSCKSCITCFRMMQFYTNSHISSP